MKLSVTHLSYQHAVPFQPSRLGLHFDKTGLAAREDISQSFLMTKQILKSSQKCNSCSSLTSCAATKSADLFIQRCQPCKKTKIIRSGSVLQGSAISTFLSPDILLLILSSRSLTNIEVAAYTGISKKSIRESRASLIGFISSWLLANATPLAIPVSSWRLTEMP
jgi:hypothetical protein